MYNTLVTSFLILLVAFCSGTNDVEASEVSCRRVADLHVIFFLLRDFTQYSTTLLAEPPLDCLLHVSAFSLCLSLLKPTLVAVEYFHTWI